MKWEACMPFDSRENFGLAKNSGKYFSILFPTETTAYFIKEHWNSKKKKMVQ